MRTGVNSNTSTLDHERLLGGLVRKQSATACANRLFAHARSIRYILRKIVPTQTRNIIRTKNTVIAMLASPRASLLVEYAAADRVHFEDKQNE